MSYIQLALLALKIFGWLTDQIDESKIRSDERRRIREEGRRALDKVLAIGKQVEDEAAAKDLDEMKRDLMGLSDDA